ncbi:hypothetical protein E8E12_011495 [Didymella heteroderae]|uniref:Uncharacterized protein n=1 Tax=Didymella heteroderae TaxID=1769908 RepID=A0A9P5C4W7_9PLEO|nr:hypothetical protein E8E12_011495 [Didymella heteroderae]
MSKTSDLLHAQRESYHKRLNAIAEAKDASTNPDLTFHNSHASPLLSLPAELRQHIFTYAYGDIVVHVHEPYDPTRGNHNKIVDEPFLYRFYATNPCWSTGFETGLQQVYHTSPWNATARGPTPLASSRTSPASGCSDCFATHSADIALARRPNVRLPLVSRLFWAEAFPAFLSNLTLQFTCPHVFHGWMKMNNEMLKHVRGLEIRMTRLSTSTVSMHWAQALHMLHMAKFEKLRGVRLLVQLGRYDALALRENYDVMSDRDWWETKLPEIICAFQQHKLDSDRTDVALLMFRDHLPHLPNGPMREPEDRKLAGVVRKALLDHDPDLHHLWRGGVDA